MSEMIGKRQLVDRAHKDTATTRAQARAALQHVIDEIVATLARGDSVHLNELGTFTIKETPRKINTLPDGTEVDTPPTPYVSFSASFRLKRMVKEGHGSTD